MCCGKCSTKKYNFLDLKLVFGHHPVHPVNGFSGAYQRDVAPENGRAFWVLLVEHGVLAYICSHILAFDVQVHAGVLQILTAGAGTAHRMPEETEYLHAMQLALDAEGLRYQVLDTAGEIREWLSWPLNIPPSSAWPEFSPGQFTTAFDSTDTPLVVWRFSGRAARADNGAAQTLLTGWNPGPTLAPLWVGLLGKEQRLGVQLNHAQRRSPHHWYGPPLSPSEPFEIQFGIHSGMGPGGLFWRWHDGDAWSSLQAASPWGAERLTWPQRWSVGCGQRGQNDRPFQGSELKVSHFTDLLTLK